MRIPVSPLIAFVIALTLSPTVRSQDKTDEKEVEKPEKAEKAEEKAEKIEPEGDASDSSVGASKESTITKLSITEAERLMKSLDLEFEEMDNGVYRFDLGDFKVLFYNKKQALQLYAGFTGFDVTLGRINEWNRTKRFSKAYLDDDDDPCLESDFDLEGGVSLNSISEFIKTFGISVETFHEHISD